MQFNIILKYVVHKWKIDPERIASEFDAGYYQELLEKAWEEIKGYLYLLSILSRKQVIPCFQV